MADGDPDEVLELYNAANPDDGTPRRKRRRRAG